MDDEEKWERLMASIRRAKRILNEDFTESEVPDYWNWPYATHLNAVLWARIYRRNQGK